MADPRKDATLNTRVVVLEQRQDGHERECAERYRGIESMFEKLCERFDERFDGLDRVLGRTEDEGLRAKVADLRSVRDKGKGAWFAIAAGAGIAATIGGWIISYIT